jgi:excisionase family DNA binding protein
MRIGLTIREAAWLLSRTESQVRRLIHAGRLRYTVRPTRLCGGSVRALFADDALRPIREAALTAILEGRVHVPAPSIRYARPLPITELHRLLREVDHPQPTSDVLSVSYLRNDRFHHS